MTPNAAVGPSSRRSSTPSSAPTSITTSITTSTTASASWSTSLPNPLPAARPSPPRHGVLAALPTPFDAAGAVAPACVAPLLDLAVENGCHGVLLAGSTGEGPSLALDERIALVAAASAWRSARGRDGEPFALLCGSGHPAWPEAARATAAVLAAGADAAVVVPPYYFKGVSDDGLADWYRRVIDGAAERLASGAADVNAGAADRTRSADGLATRILLYDIPRHTGVPIPDAVLRRLVDAYGPHGPVVGLKDSTGDRALTLHRIAALPELAIFTGTDTHLWDVLAAGGAGAITALASVRGDLLRRVWDYAAARRRDIAVGVGGVGASRDMGDVGPMGPIGPMGHAGETGDAASARSNLDAARALLDGAPAVAALKAVLARLVGGDSWYARPPLVDLRDADGAAFAEALARIGGSFDRVDGIET